MKIHETISNNPDYWKNHTFIREIKEYPKLYSEDGETNDIDGENGGSDEYPVDELINEFLSDPFNLSAIILSVSIILASLITIWAIRHTREKKGYEEFKKARKIETLKKKEPKKKPLKD